MCIRDSTYGFISGAGLSAGLWSNSEHDGTYVAAPVRGGSQDVYKRQPSGLLGRAMNTI